MRRFVLPALTPGRVNLDSDQSHHLLHVLRTRRGASIGLTDGRGAVANAVLVDGSDGIAVVEIGDVSTVPVAPARTVLLGWPKASLAEEAVQMGTEAGVTRFLGVLSARSPLPHPRTERLLRVIDAAAVQSGRADRPSLERFERLGDALTAVGDGARYVGAPGEPSVGEVLGPATIAIGPEGGWALHELDALCAAGFVRTGLGPHVLRAPTAVAVAMGAMWPGMAVSQA